MYRSQQCQGIYNLYRGILLAKSHLTPEQLIQFLRAVLQGMPTTQIAKGVAITYKTALKWHHRIQARTETYFADTRLPGDVVQVNDMA